MPELDPMDDPNPTLAGAPAVTFDPDKPRREVALEDLILDEVEDAFLAALPEVVTQLKIANLLKAAEMLGPDSYRLRVGYLDKAVELLGEP